jgi:hypothetical protein
LSEQPKITFAEPPTGNQLSQPAYDALSGVRQGFDMAMDFWRAMTGQPGPTAPPQAIVAPNLSGDDDDLEDASGVLDLRSLNQMSPEGRQAILAMHGLQPAVYAAPEVDRTAETFSDIIRQDGNEIIPEKERAESEDEDE